MINLSRKLPLVGLPAVQWPLFWLMISGSSPGGRSRCIFNRELRSIESTAQDYLEV